MYTVPAETPFTMPVREPTEATVALLVLQVPPDEVFVSVAGTLRQTVLLPAIADGAAETVIAEVVLVSEPLVLHVPAPVQVITQ